MEDTPPPNNALPVAPHAKAADSSLGLESSAGKFVVSAGFLLCKAYVVVGAASSSSSDDKSNRPAPSKRAVEVHSVAVEGLGDCDSGDSSYLAFVFRLDLSSERFLGGVVVSVAKDGDCNALLPFAGSPDGPALGLISADSTAVAENWDKSIEDWFLGAALSFADSKASSLTWAGTADVPVCWRWFSLFGCLVGADCCASDG